MYVDRYIAIEYLINTTHTQKKNFVVVALSTNVLIIEEFLFVICT